jgi:hypothetical protein
VSALADGSLRSDVRDRALAHTLTCPSCREALDVERLTVERLRSLRDPEPSAALMAMLYAMAEPGGPVPARRGFGPGMPRPLLVPVGPVAQVGPPSMAAPVRPGGSTHPGSRAAGRRMRRSVVVVAAGALGAGAVAVGVLTSAVGVGVGATASPAAQLTVQSPAGNAEAGSSSTSRPAGQRRESTPFGQSSFASRAVALTSPFAASAASAAFTPGFPAPSFPASSFPASSFPAPSSNVTTAPQSSASGFQPAASSTPTLGLSGGELIAHGPRLSH